MSHACFDPMIIWCQVDSVLHFCETILGYFKEADSESDSDKAAMRAERLATRTAFESAFKTVIEPQFKASMKEFDKQLDHQFTSVIGPHLRSGADTAANDVSLNVDTYQQVSRRLTTLLCHSDVHVISPSSHHNPLPVPPTTSPLTLYVCSVSQVPGIVRGWGAMHWGTYNVRVKTLWHILYSNSLSPPVSQGRSKPSLRLPPL